MIKVAFIGFGKFAQVRLKYIKEQKSVKVVGAFDPYQVEFHGLKSFANVEQLLAECDAVFISVPPSLAPHYTEQALAKNKHVFCEKPAAINVNALKNIPLVKSVGTVLAYGFNHRQHESVREIRKIIQSGELGSILWMRGRYGKEVDETYQENWRCDAKLNGGGILIDQGIHMVDLMSYLTGGFNGAQAVLSSNTLNITGIEDNGFITLYSTDTKVSASVHTTITQWRYLFSLEIFLEFGSLVLNGLRTNSGRYGDEILTIKPNFKAPDSLTEQQISYSDNLSWGEEVGAFFAAIKNDSPYEYAKLEDAMQTTRIIDLIYKNAVWI
jgi:1,5-anhydro-D-fructose reductase (1,5-anhydro-D-mannitol-forming)